VSLLSDLKSFLSSDKEPKHDVPRANPNFIIDPGRIKHTLRLLVESHVQVTIVVDDQSYHTCRILSVSEKGLLLDQITDHETHKKILAQKNIRINAKLNSVHCNFNCLIIHPYSDNDNAYLASLPERIYYPQKRAFFRIPLVDLETHAFNGSTEHSNDNVSGFIYDVSFGGIGIAVYSNNHIKKGDLLSASNMTLNNGQIIQADLAVCSVKRAPQERFTRVGCKFVNIEPAYKKCIHKFITACERERVKKQPATRIKNT
tara:strand:- start:412 stop:1188 length:777 start_codon:yes stop_codon:yes gene_type:complete